MFLSKENFPYQIKKEYLSKARIFKVITLIYICAYLGALISFIVLSYPITEHTRGFLIWMACFGLPPIFILRRSCKQNLIISIPLYLGQEHNWTCGPYCDDLVPPGPDNENKNCFQKLLKDRPNIKENGPAFEFIEMLNKFNVFGTIKGLEREPYYLGTYFNRSFRLDFINLLTTFSFYKKEYFILRTTPIEKIKSTILIRPNTSANNIKNLQKAEINTQNLFEIYTDNPQNIQTDLPEDFISRLVAYGKDINKTITILITPKGILCTKPETKIKDFFAPVLFRSLKNAFILEWAKYENFINLLEIINLLEPNKPEN